MLPEREHEHRRMLLLQGAVRAVAERGLENTSTKVISEISGINEVYIYRYFKNKEDLIAKAFEAEDSSFLQMILDNFPVLHYKSGDYEMRCEMLFNRCWDFLMKRPEQLLFYVRYYYSSSFWKYAHEAHMRRYQIVIDKMEGAFPPTVDVSAILHHILDTMLGMAVNQISDPQGADAVAAKKSFQIIFSVVKANVKKNILVLRGKERTVSLEK